MKMFCLHLSVPLLQAKTKFFKHFPADFGVMGYLEFILPRLSLGCLHQLIYARLGTGFVHLFVFQSLCCDYSAYFSFCFTVMRLLFCLPFCHPYLVQHLPFSPPTIFQFFLISNTFFLPLEDNLRFYLLTFM